MTGSEHAEQAVVMRWAELHIGRCPDLALLYAIPNGAKLPWKRDDRGKRFSPEAIKLKAEGLKSGVPDLCLPVSRQGYHALYIEMKYGANKPSENQRWWLDALSRQGCLVAVCWSADDAIAVLREYVGL